MKREMPDCPWKGARYTTSELIESPERRVVDLSAAGFPEIPVLGEHHAERTTGGSVYHRHAGCMEMTLCVKGSVKFDCGGQTHSLLPGSIFVSRPDDAHRLRMNQKGAFLYWLFFRLPKDDADCKVFGLSPDESVHLVRSLRALPSHPFHVGTAVRRAFEDCFRAYDLPTARPHGARSFALRVAILRLFSGIIVGAGSGANPETSGDRVFFRIVSEMRRTPERAYDMDWLVGETNLSPTTIMARFRRLVGLPPAAFLMRCRLRRAGELLRNTNRTVTDIAASLGFASSQHFATRFRQEMGMTASRWRGDGDGSLCRPRDDSASGGKI